MRSGPDDDEVLAALQPLMDVPDLPAEAELAWAPILDAWQFKRVRDSKDFYVWGAVAGRAGVLDGETIRSTPVKQVDKNWKWCRSANTLYRLGYYGEGKPLILRVAERPDWRNAAAFLLSTIAWHALTWGSGDVSDDAALISAHDLRRQVEAEDFDIADGRSDAVDLFAALEAMGRHWAAEAMIPLAAAPTNKPDLQNAWWKLKTARGEDHNEGLVLAWHALSHGSHLAADEVAADPIATAHKIAARGSQPLGVVAESGDLHPECPPGRGVVVLRSIGGVPGTIRQKEIAQASKDILGKPLPLAPMPDDLDAVHAKLLSEFPHMQRAIRTLLADLRRHGCVGFKASVLVGPPGAGKTRFVARLADLCGLPLARLDAAATFDSMVAGTAKGWSSAHPAFPVEAILSRQRADVMLLVDELEKSGGSAQNGVFANAILAMIEPATAREYPDRYYDAPVDISHISWIATANEKTGMPGPLQDRLRCIDVQEPTRDHLIPICRSIVADLAAESGEEPHWFPELSDPELAIAESLWPGGSVRRLRRIVELIVARRETHARN